MKYTFDIIIPTYNNLDELKKCLEAFEKQTFTDFRIFICVDGSTDGTLNFLSQTQYNFKYEILTHPNNANLGRNLTRNLPIPNLNSDYLLLIDSDVIPDNNLLRNHINLIENNNCISLGEVYYQNIEENDWALYLSSRGKNKFEAYTVVSHIYLNTQNVAFKTKYYVEIGGQDVEMSDSYGGDDIELGIRLFNNFNIEMIFNKKALGFSIMEKELKMVVNQYEIFGKVNLKRLENKYPEYDSIFNLKLLKYQKNSLIFKFITMKSFSLIIRLFIKYFPKNIKIFFIHYLIFSAIYRGYSSN